MKVMIIDWSERMFLFVLFVAFALSNIAKYDWSNYLLVLLEAVSISFVLLRRRALSVSEHPLDWGLAIAGTVAPLLCRPGGEAMTGPFAASLVGLGTAVSFGAKASLNRRFGMTPANRGVQGRWLYALVRHPMYLGYIIAEAGYLLHNPTHWNATVFACAWPLQAARIWREERHLSEDPAYRVYAGRVRFRLLPGLF